MPSDRLDSKLESVGAEFLVLGHLLIEGVHAFKSYTDYPGYDILATSEETGKECRIQVKSRWATDFNRHFPMRTFECDFVVVVALNRGYQKIRKKSPEDTGRMEPAYYIIPADLVRAAQKPGSKLGIVPMKNIPDIEQKYKDNWQLILEALGIERKQYPGLSRIFNATETSLE